MGSDARVRYTKRVIKESFVALLKKKPLNKVTVKEICALAEINRATFYKYYRDPFDLLDHIELEMLAQMQSSLRSSTSSFREVFLLIMASIQRDGEMYQALFSENGDSAFPGRIFSLYYEHIARDINRNFPQLSPAQQEWLYYFMSQGCCGMLERWVGNGMKERPEEVADFAGRLIANAIRQL